MALPCTPTDKDVSKYASDPDIPNTLMNSFINTRKRKQQEECKCASLDCIIDERFASWRTKLDELILERISESIKSVLTSELFQISNSLTEINTAIDGLRTDYSRLQSSLKDANDRLLEMDNALSASCERQDSFDERLKSLECQISDMAHSEQLFLLENKLATFEQQARECNIEISSVPERRGENLISIISALGSAINYQIQPTNIVSAHRVPHATTKDSRPKNIIVKFNTRILRDNVMAACRAKKGITSQQLSISGSSHKIFINEHLTLNNKYLFRECRERAILQQYKYVWVKHGVILARKSDTSPVVAVRNRQDIPKIK